MRKQSKPKSVAKLKKELDRVFSIFIRYRDNKICLMCGKTGNQAGHFISRSHNATRYDELNTHAQCVSCNIFKHGNHAEYAYRLIKKYGSKKFEELIKKGREIKQFRTAEVEALIAKYDVEGYGGRTEEGTQLQQDSKTMQIL